MKNPVITNNTNTIMTIPFPKGLYKISIINGFFNDCGIFFSMECL